MPPAGHKKAIYQISRCRIPEDRNPILTAAISSNLMVVLIITCYVRHTTFILRAVERNNTDPLCSIGYITGVIYQQWEGAGYIFVYPPTSRTIGL